MTGRTERKTLLDWARFYGVPYVEPTNFSPKPALAGSEAATPRKTFGQLVPFCRNVFKAIFMENRALTESDMLELAFDVGIDKTEFDNAFFKPGRGRPDRKACNKRPLQKIFFGVPTFIVGENLYWGNDRLILLEHALGSTVDSKHHFEGL